MSRIERETLTGNQSTCTSMIPAFCTEKTASKMARAMKNQKDIWIFFFISVMIMGLKGVCTNPSQGKQFFLHRKELFVQFITMGPTAFQVLNVARQVLCKVSLDGIVYPVFEISRHIIVAQLADLRGKYCGRSDDAGPLLVRQSPFQFLSADTPRQQTVDDACVEIVAGAYGAHGL